MGGPWVKHKEEQERIATTALRATSVRLQRAKYKKNIDSSTSAESSTPQQVTFKRDVHSLARGVRVDGAPCEAPRRRNDETNCDPLTLLPQGVSSWLLQTSSKQPF
jgi:hypothetical protein